MHHPFILVVDDDPAIREALARVLAGVGYLALTVADGSSALDQVDALEPDAVVSEVGVAGIELAARLRARGNKTPVVLVGANDNAVDLPGVRFVRGPVVIDQVTAVIGRGPRDPATHPAATHATG